MIEPEKPLLVLTGANGYIGRAVMRHALVSGWRLRALTRKGAAAAGVENVPYTLEDELAPGALDGAKAIIHLAANTRDANPDAHMEMQALRRLLAAKNKATVFVLASSQTASGDAPTGYGRLKAELEALIFQHCGIVLRPGLVYGGEDAGLYGQLSALARRLPILPAIKPSPLVQPIHVDDLAACLLAACRTENVSGRPIAAAGAPLAFDRFIADIARWRFGRKIWFIPVAAFLVRWSVALARPLSRFGFDPRRVLSLIQLPLMPGAEEDMRQLGVQLRSIQSAFVSERALRTRPLLIEGYVLMRAMLGKAPPATLMKTYVRSLLRENEKGAFAATSVSGFMLALGLHEAAPLRPDAERAVLARRWRLAAALAETAPESGVFRRTSTWSRVKTVAGLGGLAVTEALRALAAHTFARLTPLRFKD